jgi:hypothetical protein
MRTAIALLLAIPLVATAAAAQQTQQTPQPQPSDAAKAQASVPIAGLDEAALASSARASKLIGSNVHEGDATVGQIEDILLSKDYARVTAFILSVGGFLGVGSKLVAVPTTQVKLDSEGKFTTDLTKDQLSAAPAFDFAKTK